MFKQNTYTFLYLLYVNMASFMQASESTPVQIEEMRQVVENYAFYQYYPHGQNSFEVHWYKHIDFKNEISLIKEEAVTVPDNQTIEDYCNATLDQRASLLLPDHVEIIQKSQANSLIANFYRNNKLIASKISLGTYNPSTIDKLLHVKANDHFLTDYFGPKILLSEVKKVSYHNGLYPKKELFYKLKVNVDKSVNPVKLSYSVTATIDKIVITWQGSLASTIRFGVVILGIIMAIKIKFFFKKIYNRW